MLQLVPQLIFLSSIAVFDNPTHFFLKVLAPADLSLSIGHYAGEVSLTGLASLNILLVDISALFRYVGGGDCLFFENLGF